MSNLRRMWLVRKINEVLCENKSKWEHDDRTKCIFKWIYLVRLGILAAPHVPASQSTRDLVTMRPIPAARWFQTLNAVNPVRRYSIYCFVWCSNSSRIAVESWANDDRLPWDPLADAFVINFSELFWRISNSSITLQIVFDSLRNDVGFFFLFIKYSAGIFFAGSNLVAVLWFHTHFF